MSINDILVYIDNDEFCDKRVDLATGLCDVYGAHLIGVYVRQRINIPAYEGVYMPVEYYETNNKETAKLLDEAKTRFSARTHAANINSEFHDYDSDISYQLSLASRLSDLMIVPQHLPDKFDLSPYYQLPDILLSSSCPVLLLPETIPENLPPHRVMLAWDGGREAARAFKAALPLLNNVKKIDMLMVAAEEGAEIAIAQHINRHGFEVDVHQIDGGHFDVGSILLKQAKTLDSQMIVMGAYGHSRIRELILGGTTQHILEHTNLPVLFSH